MYLAGVTIRQRTSTPVPSPSQDHIGYWVGSLASAIGKGLGEELAPIGVTPGQWAILEAAFAENANTLTALARIIPVDAAAISRQLDKLGDKGLIRRRRLRSDRRTVRIELTEAGRDLVPKLAPIVQANFARFLSGATPDEYAVFIEIIRKMLESACSTADAGLDFSTSMETPVDKGLART